MVRHFPQFDYTLLSEANPSVTPLDVKPAIVGGDLPAPLDMKAEGEPKGKVFQTTVDNLHTPEDAKETRRITKQLKDLNKVKVFPSVFWMQD